METYTPFVGKKPSITLKDALDLRKTLAEGEFVVSFIGSVKVEMIKNGTFIMKMH